MTSLVVQGVCVWMIARYATVEKVSDPWRAWLAVQKATRGWVVGWFVALATCTLCMGAWISLVWSSIESGRFPWSFDAATWKLAVGANVVTLVGQAVSNLIEIAIKLLGLRFKRESKEYDEAKARP